MTNLFGEQYESVPKKKRALNPKKRAWENAFQKWSNENALSEKTHYGCCGFGAICDYCANNDKGRPCVRALNELCRRKRIEIDYSNRDESAFESLFDGRAVEK